MNFQEVTKFIESVALDKAKIDRTIYSLTHQRLAEDWPQGIDSYFKNEISSYNNKLKDGILGAAWLINNKPLLFKPKGLDWLRTMYLITLEKSEKGEDPFSLKKNLMTFIKEEIIQLLEISFELNELNKLKEHFMKNRLSEKPQSYITDYNKLGKLYELCISNEVIIDSYTDDDGIKQEYKLVDFIKCFDLNGLNKKFPLFARRQQSKFVYILSEIKRQSKLKNIDKIALKNFGIKNYYVLKAQFKGELPFKNQVSKVLS